MAKKRTTKRCGVFINRWQKVNLAKLSYLLLTLILLVSFLLVNNFVWASTGGYPKLANYFLKSPINSNEVEQLAQWDVVILGMQVQDTNPEIFARLRELNPEIKIIAYLSAMEFPISRVSELE